METIIDKSFSPTQEKSVRTNSLAWTFLFRFFLAGVFFGFVLIKAEVISWFRIQEMFRLQSFHMFGVIGAAVCTGMLSIFLIKKFKVKTIHGDTIVITPKKF